MEEGGNMKEPLEPTLFVIFGGAGDLTWRKLIPALYDLFHDGSMPAKFSIIAVDRVVMSDEKLRRHLHDGVKQFSRSGVKNVSEWGTFAGQIHYQQGDFKKIETYTAIRQTSCEAGEGMGRQSAPHLLHGHTAEHVRGDPPILGQGGTGAATGNARGLWSRSRSAMTWRRLSP